MQNVMNQKPNNWGTIPKFMVNNWTSWWCQSHIPQGWLLSPELHGLSLCSFGPAGHANAGLLPWTPKPESWTPCLTDSHLVPARSWQPKHQSKHRHAGVCSAGSYQSCTAGIAPTGLQHSWIPGVLWIRCSRSTSSCRVTMTPLSGLWLLLVVELTSIYIQFSNWGDERAGLCPGEQSSSLKPNFGMFLKTLFFFFFLIPTLRLLLQVWLD